MFIHVHSIYSNYSIYIYIPYNSIYSHNIPQHSIYYPTTSRAPCFSLGGSVASSPSPSAEGGSVSSPSEDLGRRRPGGLVLF